jgi:peptidylprolyl isomerase
MSIRLTALLAAGLVALGAAGCGDDSKNDAGIPSDRNNSTAKTPQPTASATTQSADDTGGTLTDTSKKPAVPKPAGRPPSKLVVKDIVKGKGPAAKAGDDVSVQYVGVSWSTGKEFDASWDRGEPFTFPLGGGRVIPGWDKGVPGMKVGGRRQLTIPPDLAYGAEGSPPVIAPNETLVFVVDLVKIG